MFHWFNAAMSSPPSIEDVAWCNSGWEQNHVDNQIAHHAEPSVIKTHP